MGVPVSPVRRRDILDALRRGTVPHRGLDVLAVGLDRFETALDVELDAVGQGGAHFKAVRGEYGSGKTFFARWLTEQAKKKGFATAEIQISEGETPLHRLETVYRRVIENLETAEASPSAFREIIDGWFHVLETDASAAGASATRGGRTSSEVSSVRPALVNSLMPLAYSVLARDSCSTSAKSQILMTTSGTSRTFCRVCFWELSRTRLAGENTRMGGFELKALKKL